MNKFIEKKKVEMTAAFFPQPTKLVLNKPVCAGKKRDSSVLGILESPFCGSRSPRKADVDQLLDSQESIGFLYSQTTALTQPTQPFTPSFDDSEDSQPTPPTVADIIEAMRNVLISINSSKDLGPWAIQRLNRQGKRFLERMEKVTTCSGDRSPNL